MEYNRYMTRLSDHGPIGMVTSAQIGTAVDVDPTQVRKDLGAIGVVGVGRVGYYVCDVCQAIARNIGFDRRFQAVLIGVGHLGSALLAYSGFARYGLEIVAAFDNDKRRIGTEVAGLTIRPMGSLRSFIKRRGTGLAILAIPAETSQEVADSLVSAGVKALWNFTPARLTAPDGILVRDEHISKGLAEIAHHLRK